MLAAICANVIPDYHTHQMTGLRIDTQAVATLVGATLPKLEAHFGLTRGHIHHVDNSFGFADRMPHRVGVPGVYACSAGCHPGGSVIGAAGYNAANAILEDGA